jgi:hypothetical protein
MVEDENSSGKQIAIVASSFLPRQEASSYCITTNGLGGGGGAHARPHGQNTVRPRHPRTHPSLSTPPTTPPLHAHAHAHRTPRAGHCRPAQPIRVAPEARAVQGSVHAPLPGEVDLVKSIFRGGVWGGGLCLSSKRAMTFQRKRLRLAARIATRLIRAGLALGLERQRRNKKDCGGLSRSSRKLPHLRLPLNAESAALARRGFKVLLAALGKLGKSSRLSDYRAYVETRTTTGALIKELKLKAGQVCAGGRGAGGGGAGGGQNEPRAADRGQARQRRQNGGSERPRRRRQAAEAAPAAQQPGNWLPALRVQDGGPLELRWEGLRHLLQGLQVQAGQRGAAVLLLPLMARCGGRLGSGTMCPLRPSRQCHHGSRLTAHGCRTGGGPSPAAGIRSEP